MRPTPTTEVHLRRRSTPYDFRVAMISVERGQLGLYDGTSYKYAVDAYWQAVRIVCFLGLSGTVRMELTEDRRPYGGFYTNIEGGRAVSLHIPSGQCLEWAKTGWTTENVAEKIIATIPGMPGPMPHSN